MRHTKWAAFRGEILDLYQPPSRARNTWLKVRQVLDLLEEIGARRPADLTPQLIARFVQMPGRSPNTIRGLLGYIRAICNYAVFRGVLDRSPFEFRRQWIRAAEPRPPRHLTADEVGRLLAHLEADRASWTGGRIHALIATLAYTGLRRNEALYLQTEDVEGGCIWIRARRRLKTAAAAAPVPMPGVLAEILADWTPRSGCQWLFPNVTRSNAWTGGNPQDRPLGRIAAAGLAVGIKGLTFQTFRHTWATQAEAWGLSELMVQRVLRHSRPTTQRHYRHADLDNLRSAVATIAFPRSHTA